MCSQTRVALPVHFAVAFPSLPPWAAPAPAPASHPAQGGPVGRRGGEKFCAPILERIWDYSADFVPAWGYAVWQRWQATSRRLGGLRKRCARASLCQGQPGWLQASLQDAVKHARCLQSECIKAVLHPAPDQTLGLK